MQQIKIKATGLCALLMHSDRFANPLDPATIAHKELTGKRKKTHEDHELIAKSEWLGALYHDDKMGIYIPGSNIQASIIEGAKLQKLGTACKRGLVIIEDKVKLNYSGPSDLDKLYNKKAFVDMRTVKVAQAKLMRCRPKFDEWSIEFTVAFNEQVLNNGEVMKAIDDAGIMAGLCDYRPRYGKFNVEVMK